MMKCLARRRHQGQKAGGRGRHEEGVGDGDQAAGHEPQVYGVEEEVGGGVELVSQSDVLQLKGQQEEGNRGAS